MRYAYFCALVMAMASAPTLSAFAAESNCSRQIGRENLVDCAVHASLQVLAEKHAVNAVQGRRTTANAVVGFNPVVALAIGSHAVESGQGFNGSAAISQEFEIGGQRVARRDILTSEYAAQTVRVALAERQVAAQVWLFYFEAIAADQNCCSLNASSNLRIH